MILRPELVVVRLDTNRPVDGLLHAPTGGGGVHPGQVIAKRHMQDHHDGDDRGDLQPCCLTQCDGPLLSQLPCPRVVVGQPYELSPDNHPMITRSLR
jgi:hypothetical protein